MSDLWDRRIVIPVAAALPLLGLSTDVLDTFLSRGRLVLNVWDHPNFSMWLTWAPAVALFFYLDRRWPIRRPTVATIAVHLGALLALVALHLALVLLINIGVADRLLASGHLWNVRFPRFLPLDALGYALAMSLGYALRAYANLRDRERAAARLQAALLRAEVDLLKLHLDSDALLKELDTMEAEIATSPRAAERRIEELSDVLEGVVRDKRIVAEGTAPPVAAQEEPSRVWPLAIGGSFVFAFLLSVFPLIVGGEARAFEMRRQLMTATHAILLAAFIPILWAAAAPRFESGLARVAHVLALVVFAVVCAVGAEAAYVMVNRITAGVRAELTEVVPRVVSRRETALARWFYLCAAGAALAAHAARRTREREVEGERMQARLVDAQLRALKMQLHPHFLFNTLNAIAGLLDDQPSAAQAMTRRLRDFLRTSLDLGDAQEVPLRDELRFVMNYLEIKRARFGDRMRVELAVDDSTLDARLPPLILQPLVENAVRHGVAPKRGFGTIRVTAAARGEMLALAIDDDGAGLASIDRLAPGLGLSNTRARLQHLYGARHRLTLRSVSGNGFSVELLLPLSPHA